MLRLLLRQVSPHCRRWHPVTAKHAEGTEYTVRMLYWDCQGASYYAGQIGGMSRYPTRPRAPASSRKSDPDAV